MAEPESLATHEALGAHVARHAYDRLIMLSDGIFAIATTLAALEIRIPANIPDPDAALSVFWAALVTYGVSFSVIAIFWLGSRDLFARLARVTPPITVLTLIVLCLVALIPIGTRAMTDKAADLPFHIYTVIMFGSGLANAALWSYASFAPGVMHEEVPRRYRWTRALGSLALPGLFAPLMFVTSEQFMRAVLAAAIVIVILRRGVLPRVLDRMLPENPPDEPTEAVSAGDQPGG
jgi:uncharacterized membrane protein